MLMVKGHLAAYLGKPVEHLWKLDDQTIAKERP
jgi:hypothetical protein